MTTTPPDATTEVHVGEGFSPGAEVVVCELAGENWELEKGFSYGASTRVFVVKAEEKTDFASVPRALVWLIARYGAYTLPAILHDHLYRIEVPAGNISYRDADGVLRQAMRRRGVPFLTRWVIWTAVRTATFFRRGGREAWWSDLPRVLVFLIPGGLLVAPATILVAVTLFLIYLLELVAFLGLKLNQTVRKALGKKAKSVNRPFLRGSAIDRPRVTLAARLPTPRKP
jgi:hypothetical protein